MTPAAHTTENTSSRNLWGSDVRHNTGILQIICGIIEFVCGIATISLTLKDYNRFDIDDYVSCGIWNGVCAVATGCLGVKSKRRRGMVMAYMFTSIIVAVFSTFSAAWTVAATLDTYHLSTDYHYSEHPNYGDYSYYTQYKYSDRYPYATAHFVMHIILDLVFSLQILISIIGASFTCGVICFENNQLHPVCQYNTRAFRKQVGPVVTSLQENNTTYSKTSLMPSTSQTASLNESENKEAFVISSS